jgi:hypothetical protein
VKTVNLFELWRAQSQWRFAFKFFFFFFFSEFFFVATVKGFDGLLVAGCL